METESGARRRRRMQEKGAGGVNSGVEVRFTKLHGLGNDYLYIDARALPEGDWADLARRMSDRHFGVGADGIILIVSSAVAPVGMRIFNADGSESEMCGNGLRGLAKWLYDRGVLGKEQAVETGAGVLYPTVVAVDQGRATRIRVDMGPPRWSRAAIGISAGDPDAPFRDQAVEVGGENVRATAVSMGNPHLIVFGPLWDDERLARLGPGLERHPWFPRRINVHSVAVESWGVIRMRHWERGAGATMACGTGVAAAVAAASTGGLTANRVTVHVPGGVLMAEHDTQNGHMFLEGPAVEVCEGIYAPK